MCCVDVVAPRNPGGSIVVKNMKPSSWSGRPFNFGLYKNGKLLLAQHNIGIGSQVRYQEPVMLNILLIVVVHVGCVSNEAKAILWRHKGYQRGLCIPFPHHHTGQLLC